MFALHRALSFSLVAWLVLSLTACGARSALKGELSPDVVADRPDIVTPDVIDIVDVPPDVPIDIPPDIPPRIDVACPAPIRSTQTSTVTLSASARSNLNLPLTFEWTVESRPMGSTAEPLPPTALNTLFTFDTGGEWVVRFTARDDRGTSATCTTRLFAEPAIDLLCPNDQSGFQGATLNLLASARSNLGRTITQQWSVLSAPTGSTSQPTPNTTLNTNFLLDQLGDWELQLTATDSGGLRSQCRVRLHADPDVIVQCPPDSISRPFASVNLTAMASSRTMRPLTYRWEIVNAPITSTATLGAPTQISTPFTFDVAGNWTYRFTATNDIGNFAFCTTRARSAGDEAVRVELVWNTDRSCPVGNGGCNPQGGGIDVDLHLADVSRANSRWAMRAPNNSDCFYQNCKCPMGSGMCNGTETLDWPPSGALNNPQLDIDHISDLPGPENINVIRAEQGREFDVGVHLFSVPNLMTAQTTPTVVRIYCAGNLVFESEPVRLSTVNGGSADNNPLWLVGRITTTVGGCTFARCGNPGNLSMCIKPQDQW